MVPQASNVCRWYPHPYARGRKGRGRGEGREGKEAGATGAAQVRGLGAQLHPRQRGIKRGLLRVGKKEQREFSGRRGL